MVGTIPPFNPSSQGSAGPWIRRSVSVVVFCVLCAGAMGSAGPPSPAEELGAGPTSQECAIIESALRWLEESRGVTNPVLVGRSITGLGLGTCYQLVTFADKGENADWFVWLRGRAERGSVDPRFVEWTEDSMRRVLKLGGLDDCKQEIQETQQWLEEAFPGLWAEAVEQSFDANLDPTDWSKCELLESRVSISPSWRAWKESRIDQGQPHEAQPTRVSVSRAAIHDRDALIALEYLRAPKWGQEIALFLRLNADGRWVVREAKRTAIY